MAFADFFRSFWKRPEGAERGLPVVLPPEPVPRAPLVVEQRCEPETRELLGVRSSMDQPRRVMFLDVLRTTGAFSPEEVVALGTEVIRLAMEEAGPVRLRDVASHSLFFTHDGSLGGAEPSTRFEWMAPEVIKGREQTEQTDVFVVGLAMYSALLGDRAIARGDSDLQSLERAMRVELTPLPVPPPRELDAVVRRCLAVEASDRFASLEVVAVELKQLEGNLERLKRRVIDAWEVLGRKPLLGIEPLTVPVETEAQLLARIRTGDESARAVYADHLESCGRGAEAQWLRLEQRMRHQAGAAQLLTLKAMRALSVPKEFVSSVSRVELESCAVTFGFRCPRTWDALGPTEDPLVRWCGACEERVHFAPDLETAERLTFQGRCVAVADSVARGEPLTERVLSNYVGQAPIRRTARKR